MMKMPWVSEIDQTHGCFLSLYDMQKAVRSNVIVGTVILLYKAL